LENLYLSHKLSNNFFNLYYMKVEIANLTTVDDLNSAIVLAESRKGELVYRKTIAEHDLVNRDDGSDIPDKLVENGYRLDAATQFAANAPDEKSKVFWNSAIATAKKEKDKLELRLASGAPATMNSEVAKIGEYTLLVSYYDEYIADLQTKKAAL
jgi:hypothetical protein